MIRNGCDADEKYLPEEVLFTTLNASIHRPQLTFDTMQVQILSITTQTHTSVGRNAIRMQLQRSTYEYVERIS